MYLICMVPCWLQVSVFSTKRLSCAAERFACVQASLTKRRRPPRGLRAAKAGGGFAEGAGAAGALAYFEASGSFKTGLPGQALAHEGELGGSAWLMQFSTLLARPAPGFRTTVLSGAVAAQTLSRAVANV